MVLCQVRTCLYWDHGECDETDYEEFGKPHSVGVTTVTCRAECPHGRFGVD